MAEARPRRLVRRLAGDAPPALAAGDLQDRLRQGAGRVRVLAVRAAGPHRPVVRGRAVSHRHPGGAPLRRRGRCSMPTSPRSSTCGWTTRGCGTPPSAGSPASARGWGGATAAPAGAPTTPTAGRSASCATPAPGTSRRRITPGAALPGEPDLMAGWVRGAREIAARPRRPGRRGVHPHLRDARLAAEGHDARARRLGSGYRWNPVLLRTDVQPPGEVGAEL